MSSTDLPPYDPARVLSAPFPEKIRLVCTQWASQVNPTPKAVMALYWVKYLFFYIGGWALWQMFNADYPGFTSPLQWAFTGTAFQKAMVWSIFYELCGFGCGWGPMNGRFDPWFGGFRHFLRPGTTKLPPFPKLPLLGGNTRSWLDVAIYAANQLFLLHALIAPELTFELLLPNVILIPLMGFTDKTLFLAARAEHYYVALTCIAFTLAYDGPLFSFCKLVWCFIWFWAATSKVNDHFPSVIQVMMNNGPFFPTWLKKRLFAGYPDDLRPGQFAILMSRMGTLTEWAIPFVLAANISPLVTALMLCVVVSFHGFIGINNPSGMPVEWNILMIYGAIALFGFHQDASILATLQMPWLLAAVLFSMFVIPLYGNFVPSRVSFLLAMRYYAGNWAYNVWLIRKDALGKLDKLEKNATTTRGQLTEMLQDPALVDIALAMSLAHRFMHLEGRPLLEALPRTVDRIEDYEWIDGEMFAGMIIGWNFGDGHLNNESLLNAIQPQCQFAPGEVRVLMVESQPLFGPTMHWKIVDAADGVLEEGDTVIAPMRAVQPYPTGKYADAFVRGRTSAVA
jgi:Transmembrane protein of unknown function (DUF3556)